MKKTCVIIMAIFLILIVVSCGEGKIYVYGIFKDSETLYLMITNSGSVSVSVEDKEKIINVRIPLKYAGIYVKEIEANGFSDCVNLESVRIDSGCSKIGDYAFKECTNLYKIVIPTSVKSIGKEVFKGCNELECIFYDGTKEEWNSIDKSTNWKDSERTCTIFYIDDTYEDV